MRNDFDKSFKRTKTRLGFGIISILAIRAIVISALVVGSIWLVLQVVDEINDRGLKNIIEEVWEGPDED